MKMNYEQILEMCKVVIGTTEAVQKAKQCDLRKSVFTLQQEANKTGKIIGLIGKAGKVGRVVYPTESDGHINQIRYVKGRKARP